MPNQDFFDVAAITNRVLDTLVYSESQLSLRRQAQADAQRYNRGCGLVGYETLLGMRSHSRPQQNPHPADGPDLTERERELLGWLTAAHANERIASLRHRSQSTVRNQIRALHQKVGVARRTEAIAKAATLNLQESKSRLQACRS